MEDPQPPLASSEVRYVGEAVAVVVAADATTARDAADLLEVNYEVLPAVADARAAVKLGAPFVSPLAADNLGASAVFDDASVTADAFAACDVVVEHDFRVPRVANAQMEARGALGAYDSATHSYLMIWWPRSVSRAHYSAQPHSRRTWLATPSCTTGSKTLGR